MFRYFLLVGMLGSSLSAASPDHRPAIEAAGHIPLSFERATTGERCWTARGSGYRLATDATGVEVGVKDERLRLTFVGADPKANSTGLQPLPGKVNYFVGRDPKKWLHDIPTFERVRYSSIYPGIDLIWYGNQGRLEYDLELQPGAEPSRVAMRFEGAKKLSLEANGDLRVELAAGSLSLKLPEVYQEGSAGRKRIVSSYELRAGNEVGFHVAAYDQTQPLVIDPTLVYATYFSSGSIFGGVTPAIAAVAVDGSGNVYIGGSTSSDYLLPTTSAALPGVPGNKDVFVTKFDPTGKTILYSTYFGGSNFDMLTAIAVDTDGSVVGTGFTESTDFPLVNPAQTAFNQGVTPFAFKLNPSGNALTYATSLTTAQSTGESLAVALDPGGNAYFTGNANNFQTTSGALKNGSSGNPVPFVIKLSKTGSEVYAASIDGSNGAAIAVDAQGSAYVAGISYAASFANNPPGAHPTNAGAGDAFVAKLSPDAASLVWATFLGGTGRDSANVIALGPGNIVYVGGQTESTDLPVTANVAQAARSGDVDAFVAQLSADGTSFNWVTYLGGGRSDTLVSLTASQTGVLVAGNTYSRDFPIVNALQPTFPSPSSQFFKSTDSGASFVPADSGLVAPDGGVILADPSTPGTVLLDTTYGVFRSTDSGSHWVSVLSPTSGQGSTARSLSNPSILYSINSGSISKSTDGGATWNGVPLFNTTEADILGISPTDPNILLFFLANYEYRSTNGGQSYSYIQSFPTYLENGYTRILGSPDGSIYINSGFSGLFKSADNGSTWTLFGALPAYLPGFAVSPSNPMILYASDSLNVYKSADAGSSWTMIGPSAGVKYLAIDPGNPERVFGSSSNNEGVLVSTDGGATWTPTLAKLDASLIQDIALNPFNPAELYVTTRVLNSGFVSKLSLDGKSLAWSTFYGSYDGMGIGGAALAPGGDLWIGGSGGGGGGAGGLPITPDARNGNAQASYPAFVARLSDTTAPCTYSISPGTQYSYSGGRLAFSVTTPSGCAWTATPSDSWIHVIRASGTGLGTIPLSVDPNKTASTRNGTVNVNGQIYTIVQPASSCTYQVSSPSLGSAGGTATLTITTADGCPWDVELGNSDPAAVTSATTGTGSGTVTVSVPANTGANAAVYGVQVGGSSVNILEQGSCSFSFPGGSIFVAADSAFPSTQVVASSPSCQWSATGDQNWLSLSNNSYTGTSMLSFFLTANDTGVDRVGHITIGAQQLTVTQRFTSARFADVSPSTTYFNAANLMFDSGVTTGCIQSDTPENRSFCPDEDVTRQQMAAFLVRAVTGTANPANYNPTPFFTDVPVSNPFFPHIQKLMELGITTGCGPGLFCPTNNVSRWQMAIFMVRARLSLDGAAFTTATTPYFADVPVNVEGNGQPFPFIQRSYEEHITNGCGGTSPLVYCPDGLVSRGQMASFIMRGLFNETMPIGPTDPLLTAVSPTTMDSAPGTQITVTITGINTNFQAGDTITVPSGMLAVSNVLVNSATSISATLTANANVVAGPQSLVVTSGGLNLTLPLAIHVGTY